MVRESEREILRGEDTKSDSENRKSTRTLIVIFLFFSAMPSLGAQATRDGQSGIPTKELPLPSMGVLGKAKLERMLPSRESTSIAMLDLGNQANPRISVAAGPTEVYRWSAGAFKLVAREEGDDDVQTYGGPFHDNVAVHIQKQFDRRRRTYAQGEFFIFDSQGKVTMHLSRFEFNFNPVPSPSGDYAVGGGVDFGTRPPMFIDAAGVRNKWAVGAQANSPWPRGFATERVFFSRNGKRVAVAAMAGERDKVLGFDSRGNVQWMLDERALIFFQRAGDGFIKVLEGQVALCDSRARILWKTDVPGIGPWSYGVIDSHDKVFAVTTKSSLIAIDTQAGAILWNSDTKSLPEMGGISGARISGLEASDDLGRIALAIYPWKARVETASNGRDVEIKEMRPNLVAVFDKGGVLLDEIVLPPLYLKEYRAEGVSFRISPSGKKLFIPGEFGVASYSIHE